MDLENEVEDQIEEVVETPEVTEAEPSETPVEGEAASEVKEEEPAEGEESPSGKEASAEEGEEDSEQPGHKPNFKFKAGIYNKETKELGQKELEIDKSFAPLMKTPEGEKLIRELHEKAHGLDSVKERLAEAKNYSQQIAKENSDITGSINELRTIYQSAVKTKNYHKLDSFFEKLNVSPEVVLNYAYEKAKLMEMPPEQRQVVESRLEADRRADELSKQNSHYSEEMVALAQQTKTLQLQTVLASPEISQLAQAFDERLSKPGAFEQAVIRAGQVAWALEKKNLTVPEAVRAVINDYGLTTKPNLPPGKQSAQAADGSGVKKPVIQRETQTIPNVQGRSSSPLAKKPRSVEDIKKYYKENYANK